MQNFQVTIQGHTVEGLGLTDGVDLTSFTITDCVHQYVTLSASPSYGVPGYTYLWTPGGVTTSSYFVTPSPGSTTIYTVTITDACGNTVTDNITIINSCLTLPLNLLSFSGYNDKNINYLNWVTASEENSSYFEIEHSTNGEEFQKIGEIKAAGNSTTETNYQFTDDKNTNALNYYRLKQVDIDNTFKYSSIISIQGGLQSSDELSLTISQINYALSIASPVAGNATITIFDIEGRLMQTYSLLLGKGINTALINYDRLPAGVYIAKAEVQGKSAEAKFLKQ